jgi:hypothetical protein
MEKMQRWVIILTVTVLTAKRTFFVENPVNPDHYITITI